MKKLAVWQGLKFGLVVTALFVFSGCSDSVYRKSYDFKKNQWPREDVKKFEFSIESAGSYNILLEFRHVYETPLDNIPIAVTFKGPESNKAFTHTLRLTDSSGKMLSDCLGDVCDLEQLVLENETLTPGNYVLTLAHGFDHAYLPNTPSVGIKVAQAQ